MKIITEPTNHQHIRVQVIDTGIGIHHDDVPRLFTEFQQLNSSVARRYEGTGLGLALTKKIVEYQAGSIEVASKIGQGSTFTVLLPMGNKEVSS